jgi:hypothetical protein
MTYLFNGVHNVWPFFCTQLVCRLSLIPLNVDIFTYQILCWRLIFKSWGVST